MHKNAATMEYYRLLNQLVINTLGIQTFAENVKYGGKWDYKIKYGYKTKYVFRGKTITGSDFGNIHYGYVGTALGLAPYQLKTAAGLAQFLHGYYHVSWFKYYFDEPRDSEMIQYGIDLYRHGY